MLPLQLKIVLEAGYLVVNPMTYIRTIGLDQKEVQRKSEGSVGR